MINIASVRNCSKSSAVLALLAACVVCVGCDDDAVVVEIRTDLTIPGELDGLCIEVSARGATPFARRYVLGGTEVPALPATLTVLPGAGSAPVATARGYRDGREVLRARTPLSFSGVSHAALGLLRCVPAAGVSTLAVRDEVSATGAHIEILFGRGRAHLVVIEASAVRVLVSDGAALMPEVTGAPPVVPAGVRALAAADVDGDCDDDLVVVTDAAALLWRHDGRGGLTAEALPGAGLGAAALGDVDGDGDADLVLAGGARVRLLVNDGAGRFSEAAAAITPMPTDATALDLGDFTGDGALDLIIGQGGAAAAPARAYVNDGAGHLAGQASAAYLPETPLSTRAVSLADLDGDGDLDAVLAGLGGAHLYVNRGSGRFDDRSFERLPVASDDLAAAVSGDLDGDCLPELALTRSGAATSLLTGTGTGALAPATLAPRESSRARIADLDGDGLRDLVLAGAANVTWVAGR